MVTYMFSARDENAAKEAIIVWTVYTGASIELSPWKVLWTWTIRFRLISLRRREERKWTDP